MDEKFVVYMHTTPSNKRYIGITNRDPKKRWNGGAGYSGNLAFKKEIKQYGWREIKHEILYEGLSKEDAMKIEAELIELYDTTNPEKGFNCTSGGDYHNVLTPQAKARMSKTLSAKARNKRKCKCLETGVVFESQAAAAKVYKIAASSVRQSCRSGGRVPAKGHHFVYDDEKGREQLRAIERANNYSYNNW